MLKRFNVTALLLLLLTATGGGLLVYHENNSPERQRLRDMEARDAEHIHQVEAQNAELQAQVESEKKQKEQFKKFVQNLTASQPVAEIVVRDPVLSDGAPGGVASEILVFTEVDDQGNELGPPREFPISGKRAHLDAEVIKFDAKFVEESDPARGRSVILFRSLYDQNTSPERAFEIDKEGEIPPMYRNVSPELAGSQQKLWSTFWKLVDDPAYRKESGVRVAQGEGVWGDFDFGYRYRISVDSYGGANIVKEKLSTSIINALKGHQHSTSPATNAVTPQ